MLIGYARVSSNDQDTAVQVAALKAAKCERIYREQASGGRWDRPELQRLLDQLPQGRRTRGVETRPAIALTAGCADHYGAVGRGQSGISEFNRGESIPPRRQDA
jgi:predicted site-specific integrase-resolvase